MHSSSQASTSITMVSKLSYFFEKTSLHGFKYLNVANEPCWKRVFARVFWTSCLAFSITLMCSTLSTTINDFGSKSTSINLDTNYRDWNNTFPAISICMMKGRSTTKLKEYMENYWSSNNIPIPPRAIRYYRAIQSLMFINYHQPLDGVNVADCMKFNNTCGIDLNVLKNDLLPQTCNEFMVSASWLGREVPCETIFKLHKTEIGQCFIANSLYSDLKGLKDFQQLPLRHSNQEIIERSLKLKYVDLEFVIYKLFIHSPEELPDGNLEGYLLRKAESFTYMALKTTEIMNQNEVHGKSIESRQCRFPYDYLKEYKLPYSISNCHTNERILRETSDCNCTLPIGNFSKDFTICNITRYECVKESFEKVKQNDADDKKSKTCVIPSCVTMEINLIGLVEKDYSKEFGLLQIEILNKPSLRYIRRVSISNLDLIGG